MLGFFLNFVFKKNFISIFPRQAQNTKALTT